MNRALKRHGLFDRLRIGVGLRFVDQFQRADSGESLKMSAWCGFDESVSSGEGEEDHGARHQLASVPVRSFAYVIEE